MNLPLLGPWLAALLLLLPVSTPAAELFPFVLPWDDATPSVTDLSPLLEKPAGAHGFIVARDSHFYSGPNRLRFFGVNVAFGGNFPTHADAEKVAARMAKYGINCVRFHHLDTGTAPAGLLQPDRRTFDPESLDRLDYFIAQLKNHGIYADLNLHVGNDYPGLPKWEGGSNYFKGVDNFFPAMIEQQRAYATALLTHVNPYTHLAYTADPAVALIEINNENGLIMEWNNRALDAMPNPYALEFTRQWNAWLERRYGSHQKLAAAWQQGEEPLGAEMLPNGFFAQALTGWNLEQHGGAQAAVTLSPPNPAGTRGLKLTVTKPGEQTWHVQLSHGNLALAEGKNYTLSFYARADHARKISVSLSQSHEPWKVLASHPVPLGPGWQQIEVALSATESDEHARLMVSNLGGETGETEFTGFSLRPGGVSALSEGEQLGDIAFFHREEIGRRTLPAQRDWNRFLIDTETAYWTGMSSFLKDQLGAHSLVLGSATGFSPWLVQSELDVVDAHAYWQHPHFPHRPWDQNDWTVKNLPMAGEPGGGTLPNLALRRVAGKPFIVTEYNHASPNQFSSEAFLELCAVASLQDWDGLFAFAYSHRLDDWDTRRITSFFDLDQHPGKMATLPAALSLFYRADLPVGETHVVQPTLEEAIESIRTGSSWVTGSAYGLQPAETFQHPIAMRLGQGKEAPGALQTVGSGEGPLRWDVSAHQLLLLAPRALGVIGRLPAGESIQLGPLQVIPGSTRLTWGTINVTVLEGTSLADATRLLITATGDVENTGLHWVDPTHTSVGTQWGQAPSLVEGIPATLSFPSGGRTFSAWALDERGQRKTPVPMTQLNEEVIIYLSPEHHTLWWEVAITPASHR